MMDTPMTLSMKDPDGDCKVIQQRNFDKSEVTLGVHCSPNGEMKYQIQWMKEKLQDWADKSSAEHMDQVNIAVALSTTI